MKGWQPDEEDWRDIRRGFLAGAAAGSVVVLWMWLAHPGEETISSRGFDMSAAFSSSAPDRPAGRIFAQRGQGEVPAAVRHESLSVSSAPSSPLPVSGAAPVVVSPAPAAAAAAPEAPASDPQELAKAGLPTDARGLTGLGAQKGLLSAVVEKFLDHPAVLKAVFDNKLVVEAFMSRDVSKRNCADAGALTSYLANPSSAGMTKVFPVLQAVLSHPDAAASLAGTEMSRRLTDCPSVKALSSDKAAVGTIAMSNPQAVVFLADPRLVQALASNPQAASLIGGISGGGAPQR